MLALIDQHHGSVMGFKDYHQILRENLGCFSMARAPNLSPNPSVAFPKWSLRGHGKSWHEWKNRWIFGGFLFRAHKFPFRWFVWFTIERTRPSLSCRYPLQKYGEKIAPQWNLDGWKAMNHGFRLNFPWKPSDSDLQKTVRIPRKSLSLPRDGDLDLLVLVLSPRLRFGAEPGPGAACGDDATGIHLLVAGAQRRHPPGAQGRCRSRGGLEALLKVWRWSWYHNVATVWYFGLSLKDGNIHIMKRYETDRCRWECDVDGMQLLRALPPFFFETELDFLYQGRRTN